MKFVVEEAPVTVHPVANGITLLGQKLEGVSSGAFSILVPLGAALDPEGFEGVTAMLVEMFGKGAGHWNSKELSEQFENIGAHQGHSAGIEVSVFSAALLGENLAKALDLYSTMLLLPKLPPDELESVKKLQLQELSALEDQPASKVMVELAKQFYPHPYGKYQVGTTAGVKNITHQVLSDYYRQYFTPNRAIIAVSGDFDWNEVKRLVEEKFGSWRGSNKELPHKSLSKTSKTIHVEQDTKQLQIALAYPSVSFDHPDYYAARVAISVLSGGMSGRLFVEVREKRGLVYRVSASHSATKGRAAIFAYAGTTPENSEETLQVMVDELRKIKLGVEAEELARAKADLKARLVMQGESTSARSSALANDWWNLGRVRGLTEIKEAIDKVTSEDIERHFSQYPAAPITLVTLGPKKLELPT